MLHIDGIYVFKALQVVKRNRTDISAQRAQVNIDSHNKETQPVAATVANKALNSNACSRCELRFNNHKLLLEHYRTSSMHRFCLDCFQVFPSKELLDHVSSEYLVYDI